jgi:hypothetical protein
VTVTVSSVSSPGEMTLTTSAGGPAVPSAFTLGNPPVFYNLATTATFSGPVTVCIDISAVSFPTGSTLRLLHYENGAWTDVTSSGPAGGVICGSVTSLSPFTVASVINSAPEANAGAAQTVECAGPGGTPVTLNGAASSDPDGNPLTYVWRDGAGTVVGTTAVASVTLPMGYHTFTLTVTDPFGASASAVTSVTVRDTVAPAVSVTMTPGTLWPANGKMVAVTAVLQVSDACDANPSVVLVSITSSETLAIGDVQGAALGTDDRAFSLRAKRAGNGAGRTYTVTYRVTDASGNSTTRSATVVVPHDQGKGGMSAD